MNRAKRRREKRYGEKKAATYNVSHKQIEELALEKITEIRKSIQHEAVAAVVSVFLVNLHDEYGFGKKRLQRLLDRFHNTYECVHEDPDVKIEDFIQICLDDFEIDIRMGDRNEE